MSEIRRDSGNKEVKAAETCVGGETIGLLGATR